jgi:hypothetical protein
LPWERAKHFTKGNSPGPVTTTPSTFSPFTIMEVATDDVFMNTHDVYISTTELNGEKMSPKEIKKWLKQAIKVPGTYHELIEQANIYASGLEILGGDKCYCVFKVKAFVKVMKTLKKKIEAQITRNKDTAPYILFQIHLQVNNYLAACKQAQNLDNVPKSILNMPSIEDKIRNLELSPVLPSSFKNGKRENNEEEDNNNNEPHHKKRRKNSGGNEKSSMEAQR